MATKGLGAYFKAAKITDTPKSTNFYTERQDAKQIGDAVLNYLAGDYVGPLNFWWNKETGAITFTAQTKD